ncbi:MAG: oligosaccharide flippase family protein [Cytophagales bacterium]|nr:oligosaccharide flippase family protein [Cytophagales bacterium]
MSALKRLASDTVFYGMGTVIPRLLNYLLVPLYTGMLTTSENGVIVKLYAYAAFFVILYTYGQETALFRFSNHKDFDKKQVFSTGQSSVMLTSLLFSGALCLFASLLVNYLELPGKEKYIYLMASVFAVDAFMALPFAKLRLESRPIRFASVKIINILLTIGLNLFFIFLCKKISTGDLLAEYQPYFRWYDSADGPFYVCLANLIANGLTLFFLLDTLKGLRLHINKRIWKTMLSYGVPLLFNGFLAMFIAQSSVLMLDWLLPDNFYPGLSKQDILGIYGQCAKLAVFMQLGVMAFRYASEPFFFAKAKDKNSPELFAKVMYYFVLLCSVVFVSVATNLDLISRIFLRQEAFHLALDAVPFLLMAQLFLGIYFNISIWFKLTDQTHMALYFTLGGALLSFGLSWFLIPLWGYMGGAVSITVTYLAMCVANYLVGQKKYPIPYPVSHLAGILLGSLLISFLIRQIQLDTFAVQKTLQAALLVLYLGFVFFYEKRKFGRRTP